MYQKVENKNFPTQFPFFCSILFKLIFLFQDFKIYIIIRGSYSNNQFYKKKSRNLLKYGGSIFCFFLWNWRGVGKKGEEKGKRVVWKFSFRIVSQNTMPFSLVIIFYTVFNHHKKNQNILFCTHFVVLKLYVKIIFNLILKGKFVFLQNQCDFAFLRRFVWLRCGLLLDWLSEYSLSVF